MKQVLFALFLISSSAFATSIDNTQIVASLSGYQEGIKQVVLLTDSRLQVILADNQVITKHLNPATMNQLFDSAAAVANAEVETTHRSTICKMMLLPQLSDLHVSPFNAENFKFEGSMRLILTARSCAVSTEVFPKVEFNLLAANRLHDQLLILALSSL